ncbi:ANTH domain-containing protein [Phascolomyces articulosus]|uniref:ANTH domain-containing protein n=1 Tax=Phascolomyces articulosus TaxID=60185 RepID=A0AAD5JLI8_9FUNG|nr:ANTH domain-containing protein [Phascolomyces articulosus]
MSGIMDTAVRKATRLDYQAPKQKHINTLNALTFQYPASVVDIVDLLERRVRENSWIVTFKVLIILHTLMREGNGDKVIACIDNRPSALDTTRVREKSSGTMQIQNIYLYSHYLQQKVQAFRQLGLDHVKFTMAHKTGKLRHLSVANGLLKETVVVQKLIGALLKCSFQFDDGENGIGLNAFRLLVEDLFVLFQTVNEAIVNILEHYFAMPKNEARLSLEVYKRFSKQTEHVVAYLNRARILEHELGITIPEARHAPLSLATALEEYLNDAQSSGPAKQSTSSTQQKQQSSPSSNNNNNNSPTASQPQEQQQPKELIDFFASLENETTNMVTSQPTGMAQYNPFRTTPVPMQQTQQQQLLSPPTPTSSVSTTAHHNPFRASVSPQQSISTPTSSFNTNTTNISMQQQFNNNPNPNIDLSLFTTPTNLIPQQQRQQQQQQQAPFNPIISNNQFNPFSTSSTTTTTPIMATTTTSSIVPSFQQPMMTAATPTTNNSNPFFGHQPPAAQQAQAGGPWF